MKCPIYTASRYLLFAIILVLSIAVSSVKAWADSCSSYIGNVAINEVLTTQVSGIDPFVELYVLSDITIPTGWSVTVRPNQGNGGSNAVKSVPGGFYSAGDFIVLAFASNEVKNNGNDVLLKDESGNSVYFLRFGGNRSPLDPDCDSDSVDDTRYSHSASEKDFCSIPDGSGNWMDCASGPTQGVTNSPGGGSCDLGGFEITPASTALACPSTRSPFTVRTLCADLSTTKDDYAGAVQLSTGLSGSEFYSTATGGNSISSHTFNESDNGLATLYLYHNNEEGVAVTITDSSLDPDIISTSSAIDFRAFGLVSNTTIGSPIAACEASGTYSITAFGQVEGNTGCSVIQGFSGEKNIKLWSNYVSPGSNPSNTRLNVNGVDIPVVEDEDNTVEMSFVNGVADFSLSYPDAGQVKLLFKHDEAPYNNNPHQPMQGETNIFTVIPDSFSISASTASESLHGADHNATEKAVSGSPFNLSIQAQCSDGTLTSNYQPTDVEMTLTQYLPTNGASGVLRLEGIDYVPGGEATNISALFSEGAVLDTESKYSEVGVIKMKVEDTGYFDGTIGPTIVDIGRFYPDHFSLLVGSTLSNRSDLSSCMDTFSYMGETFNVSYALEAQNSSDVRTQNYTGSFAKLDSYDLLDIDAVNGGINLTSRLVDGTTLISWSATGEASAGVASISVDLTFNRDASVDGPFNSLQIGTAPEDNDAVSLVVSSYDLDTDGDLSNDHKQVGLDTVIRYGRFVINNAFGPETDPLAMVAQTEYWDGSRFLINTDDNCIELDIETTPAGPNIAVGGGTTTLSNNSPVTGGNLGIVFEEPGAGNSGSIDVRVYDSEGAVSTGISSIPWLLYDWDGDGSYDDDPGSRTATFGRYRGHDRVIFWMEDFSE